MGLVLSLPSDDSENSKIHVIRLLSYVEGVLLSDVKPTESILIQAGSFVGRVQQELKVSFKKVYKNNAQRFSTQLMT